MQDNAKTALVVDDSKLARYVLKEMLLDLGMKVETADSGEEALGYLAAHQPDLIFMDHIMPGMDGLQALKAIKEETKTHAIPVLMYTSKRDESYREEAKKLGAVGVLPKKLKPSQLERILTQLNMIVERPKEEATINLKSQAAITAASQKKVSNALETLASNASEELEKDTMRALFAQLLNEQRDAIQQDQEKLIKSMKGKKAANNASFLAWPGILAPITVLALVILAIIPWFMSFSGQSDNSVNLKSQVIEQQKQMQDLKQSVEELKKLTLQKKRLQHNERYTAIQWALNRDTQIAYSEGLYGEKSLLLASELIEHLNAMQFKGNVRMRFHSGLFCEQTLNDDRKIMAPANTPFSECSIATEEEFKERIEPSIGFINFLSEAKTQFPDIHIMIEEMGSQQPSFPYPEMSEVQFAGEWNRIAMKNHRLEIALEARTTDGMIGQL